MVHAMPQQGEEQMTEGSMIWDAIDLIVSGVDFSLFPLSWITVAR